MCRVYENNNLAIFHFVLVLYCLHQKYIRSLTMYSQWLYGYNEVSTTQFISELVYCTLPRKSLNKLHLFYN